MQVYKQKAETAEEYKRLFADQTIINTKLAHQVHLLEVGAKQNSNWQKIIDEMEEKL